MERLMIVFTLIIMWTTAINQNDCITHSTCSIFPNQNLNFGDLLKYNIFTSQHFTNNDGNPSAVEGRVAVGGHHNVPTGHQIGEKLCNYIDPSLIENATCQNLDDKCCNGFDSKIFTVRDYTYWIGGRIFFGGACIGNSAVSWFGHFAVINGTEQCIYGHCSVNSTLLPNCSISFTCVPKNSWWDQMTNNMKAISNTLYGLPANSQTFWGGAPIISSLNDSANYSEFSNVWDNHLWLQPLNQTLHVFEINALILNRTRSFLWAPNPTCILSYDQTNISNCADNFKPLISSHVIINVKADIGQECRISHVDLNAFAPFARNIIWNFGECSKVFLRGDDKTGVDIYGMILAPSATLSARGSINGQVFVNNFAGGAIGSNLIVLNI